MSQPETTQNDAPEETNTDKANLEEEKNNKLLNASAEKAIEQYRKLREGSGTDLTDKEIAEIEKQCEIIRNREIITQDVEHKPTEITTKNGEIITGPPTLTRF